MGPLEQKADIALYEGPGAELVSDVESVLQHRVPYRMVTAAEIRNGILDKFRLLIMSGGITANYIPHLKPLGCKVIKTFLNNQGGRYLGICAGAYLAGTAELGISKSKMVRKSGIFNCEITIHDLAHPIFEAINTSILTVFYQNGPHIQPYADEKSLACYEDGSTSVIETRRALIFSWHPEKLPHTIPILLKSIQYLIAL